MMRHLSNALMLIADRNPDVCGCCAGSQISSAVVTSRRIRRENLNDVLAAPRRTIAAIMAIRAKLSNATVMTESRELVAQSEALLLRHTGLVRHIA